MQFKDGVIQSGVQPEIWFALGIAALLSDTYRRGELVVTSLVDGVHMKGSLHYQGRAADLRTVGYSDGENTSFYNSMRYYLKPLGYDVVLETSPPHVHVEYDPKEGRDWGKYWGPMRLSATQLMQPPIKPEAAKEG